MQVLYEDNHIIAVSKTCHEIVQGDKTGDTPLSETVKAYIKEKYQKPGEVFLGVTHRLDRPTTGVVLFARTSKALTRLNAMFQSHEQIQKTYWAIVSTDNGNRISDNGNWQFVHSNFRYLTNFMRFHKVDKVDGILGDLGVSFHHFDTPERGFSFRFSGALDMRMNARGEFSATDLINTYSAEQLADIQFHSDLIS